MGTSLAMYVHKDVPDHDRVVDLITVSPSAARRYDLWHVYPPSRVFAVIFKFYTSCYWLCNVFLGCSLSRAVQCFSLCSSRKTEAQLPTLTVASVIS